MAVYCHPGRKEKTLVHQFYIQQRWIFTWTEQNLPATRNAYRYSHFPIPGRHHYHFRRYFYQHRQGEGKCSQIPAGFGKGIAQGHGSWCSPPHRLFWSWKEEKGNHDRKGRSLPGKTLSRRNSRIFAINLRKSILKHTISVFYSSNNVIFRNFFDFYAHSPCPSILNLWKVSI